MRSGELNETTIFNFDKSPIFKCTFKQNFEVKILQEGHFSSPTNSRIFNYYHQKFKGFSIYGSQN